MANAHLERAKKPPLFEVHLVGTSLKSQTSNGIFTIKPDTSIELVEKTDLLIIPAIHGDINNVIESNSAFIPWIVKQYKGGAQIASLCIGAFLLASTGLLDGKNCATHWLMAKEFREMFPNVNLVDDKIITDEHGIYTSGGAYSSLNLNLYLIEKLMDRDMAVLSSKIFEIDIDRDSQSPFIIFKGQKEHKDEEVKLAQEYIEMHYSDKLLVDDLCMRFAVGRRTFERRFKKSTANTILEYIQRVRTEAAKKILETGHDTVNQIMYEVGYNDPKAFRQVFKKITGLTPLEYKTKFCKHVS